MSQPVTSPLTEADQQLLLKIVRTAVRTYLSGQTPAFPNVAAGLMDVRGVFVSLHRGVDLRGCIGNINAVSPLYRTAAECAIAAAVGDPRFMPLSAMELPNVDFEISVLSPLKPVHDISEIEIGVHGLVVSKRNARGLLLPQVAAMYGWSLEQFLRETCKKAGLKPDDWKEDAIIQRFSALVFSEKKFNMTFSSPD